ncbi:MAG: hypothetical protein LBV31_03665, partial [Prevotellaceae bacterium]|nr:hypothetical protein [Prevotellaceae bacterium]
DAEGNFSGYIRQGNIVKPYLGIGLGKTIPNSRIGFRFDLGVLYLGKIKFISDNVEGANFTISSDQMKAEDVGDAALTLFKVVTAPVFPNMQFTLSYRIF